MRPPWRGTIISLLFLHTNDYRCMHATASRSNFSTGAHIYHNLRWMLRGLGDEICTNVANRILPIRRTTTKRHDNEKVSGKKQHAVNGELAVVTGATGGIGSEICLGLVRQGYHVIVAARNKQKGEALVKRLHEESSPQGATYIQLNAEDPKSALNLAFALRNKSCAILINNAAVMYPSACNKREIMRVNLVGPAILFLSLIPALRRYYDQSNSQETVANRCRPIVVNVSSSSHLRTGSVDPSLLLEKGNLPDSDLMAYSQSKLGLMQLSTLWRKTYSSPPASSWLTIVDAHPGLVWTPMLKNYQGRNVPILEKTGMSRLFFKSPKEGAATILCAVEEREKNNSGQCQTYYCNCKPGGFASPESRDFDSAKSMYMDIIDPIARDLIPSESRKIREEILRQKETGHNLK